MTHPEFAPELADLLRKRRYSEAVWFWRAARPLAQLTVPSIDNLAQIMETDPPCLAFLRPHELSEIQVAAGFASLVGATRRLGRFVDSQLRWPHPLSKDAAVHNLLSAFRHEQFLTRTRSERFGCKTRVRVQNSCEGACITCLLASSRDFPLDYCPPVPIVGCINHKDGCRCSIEVTNAVSEREALTKLF